MQKIVGGLGVRGGIITSDKNPVKHVYFDSVASTCKYSWNKKLLLFSPKQTKFMTVEVEIFLMTAHQWSILLCVRN